MPLGACGGLRGDKRQFANERRAHDSVHSAATQRTAASSPLHNTRADALGRRAGGAKLACHANSCAALGRASTVPALTQVPRSVLPRAVAHSSGASSRRLSQRRWRRLRWRSFRSSRVSSRSVRSSRVSSRSVRSSRVRAVGAQSRVRVRVVTWLAAGPAASAAPPSAGAATWGRSSLQRLASEWPERAARAQQGAQQGAQRRVARFAPAILARWHCNRRILTADLYRAFSGRRAGHARGGRY